MLHEPVGVETAAWSEWQDPSVVPPPQGKKILLLTEWGIAVLGIWRHNNGLIAWAPLPRVPVKIKEKMR